MYNLKEKRLACGLTQADVARRAEMPQRTYQNYEMGIREPSVTSAIKIAKALNTTVEEIWGQDG